MDTTQYTFIVLGCTKLWPASNEKPQEMRIKTWRPETVTQMLCVSLLQRSVDVSDPIVLGSASDWSFAF